MDTQGNADMRDPESLTIGKVADQGGVKVQTIRYYERRGLLPKPARTASGYRMYSDDAIRRLRFIRQAQALGFSLSEIEELLSLRMRPGSTCGDIRQRARQKISMVNKKIDELHRIKGALSKLATACQGKGPTSECPILEALESERD
ncbi:MAG TPA: MerR family transcriptional regulator [Burkholderiales bacterium]|nr:MerR family transcriptional regulator [Burkholderiales bacterium]